MQNNLKTTGEMKLGKITLVFFVLFSFGSRAQVLESKYPKVSVIESDTVIIFSFSQSQKLAIINEDKKRLEKLNQINEKQIASKDSIIKYQYNELVNSDKINQKQQRIIQEKDKQIKLSDSQNTILLKEIRKQVRQKWIAIASGIAGFATITYFYLTK
jgi:basic membrane lipoprotein Med (substrate-binding protein (PBP1-ABC) superfamily)